MIISIKEVKKFIICILIPLLVGVLSLLISNLLASLNINQAYTELAKPTFAPGANVYQVVWPILYILMGASFYIINSTNVNSQKISDANFIYYVQLALNFLWTIFFFGLELRFVALADLFLLVLAVIFMIYKFASINNKAATLNLFYLAWTVFAFVLNYFVWILNK